ncbi:MAG: DUF2079 domain-containing protein [Chthoniobacteraceae bacterium]
MFYDRIPTPRTLWWGTIIFSVIAIADSWFRWATFQYTTFDLAFYAQGLWLAGKGIWNVSLLGVPLMGNHQDPIVFLALPFYKIWSHPMLLVILQTLLLATMPFTGWRIARHLELGQKAAVWLGLATLLAPATGFVALHEFHPEALAAPLLLLMFEARMMRRLGLFWVLFILVLACKESMGLLLAWISLVYCVIERDRDREWRFHWNIIPGCVALGWFLLCVLAIGPALNGGRVDFLELYSHLGNSGGAILGGFLTHPSTAAAALWRGLTSGDLVWGMLVPFLLLPVLRPRWIIMAAPIFLQHLLSWRESEWSIHFHYAAPLVPLLWLGAAEASAALFWRDVLAGWVVVACAICQFWFGPIRSVWRTVAGSQTALWARGWKSSMLAVVSPNDSVTAGIPYLSHLTNRTQLYSLHHVLKGLNTLSRTEYKPPAVTDVLIMDTADRATFDVAAGFFHPQMRTVDGRVIPASDLLLHQFMSQQQWHPIARNEFAIFLKGAAQTAKSYQGEGRKLDDYNSLVAFQGMPPLAGDSMLFGISWELKPGRQSLLAASLYLRAEDGRLFLIGKGPIAPGVESGRYTEAWSVRQPPSVPPGKYRGILLIYDPLESSTAPERHVFKRVTFDVGEFNLK